MKHIRYFAQVNIGSVFLEWIFLMSLLRNQFKAESNKAESSWFAVHLLFMPNVGANRPRGTPKVIDPANPLACATCLRSGSATC